MKISLNSKNSKSVGLKRILNQMDYILEAYKFDKLTIAGYRRKNAREEIIIQPNSLKYDEHFTKEDFKKLLLSQTVTSNIDSSYTYISGTITYDGEFFNSYLVAETILTEENGKQPPTSAKEMLDKHLGLPQVKSYYTFGDAMETIKPENQFEIGKFSEKSYITFDTIPKFFHQDIITFLKGETLPIINGQHTITLYYYKQWYNKVMNQGLDYSIQFYNKKK